MKTFKFVTILFFLACTVRALVFYHYLAVDQHYWQVDSNTYHVVAEQIAQGNGISNRDGSPHFYRVPGYSLFLALCYKVFGVSQVAALWVQVVLASGIPVVIFFLTRSFFPGTLMLAQACSLFSVFHLGLVLYAGFFMTESLFIIIFLLFLLFFVHAYRHATVAAGYYYLVAAGLFLGLASLVRPVGHYLLVVALVLLVLSRTSWRVRMLQSMTFAGAWLIPVSLWLVRNYLLTGVVFFHTLPGGHFLYLSAARVAMHVHHVDYQEARDILSDKVQQNLHEEEAARGRTLQEIESCQVHERLALHYFAQRPCIALKYWATDMLRASLSLYSAELVYLASGRQQINYFAKDRGVWPMFKRYLVPATHNGWLLAIIYVEIIIFLLLLIGFIGFLMSVPLHRHFFVCMLSCLFIMLFIVIALAGGYARMRLPIEPLLIMLSGYWWIQRFYKQEKM